MKCKFLLINKSLNNYADVFPDTARSSDMAQILTKLSIVAKTRSLFADNNSFNNKLGILISMEQENVMRRTSGTTGNYF